MSLAPFAPSIHLKDEGDSLTARFVGLKSLTEEHSELLDREFDSLASEQRKVRLDFVAVEYLTSLPMGKVLKLHQRLLSTGGSLSLVNLKPLVAQAFKVTRLDKVLNIENQTRPLSA
jgi:anti-anti-sigma factor